MAMLNNQMVTWSSPRQDTFQCGRTVDQLVKDLETGKVDISAPFLRLTVFETRDEKSRKPELPRGPATGVAYLVANYPRLVVVGYNPSDLHGISRANPLITGVKTHLRAVG